MTAALSEIGTGACPTHVVVPGRASACRRSVGQCGYWLVSVAWFLADGWGPGATAPGGSGRRPALLSSHHAEREMQGEAGCRAEGEGLGDAAFEEEEGDGGQDGQEEGIGVQGGPDGGFEGEPGGADGGGLAEEDLDGEP